MGGFQGVFKDLSAPAAGNRRYRGRRDSGRDPGRRRPGGHYGLCTTRRSGSGSGAPGQPGGGTAPGRRLYYDQQDVRFRHEGRHVSP